MSFNEKQELSISDVLSISVGNRLKIHSLKEEIKDVKATILEIILTRRLYLVKDQDDFSDIWDLIRVSTATTDFIIGCTNDFKLNLFEHNYSFETIVTELAKTLGQHTLTNSSVLDDELLERLPLFKEYSSLLQANHWFALLLLIEQNIEILTESI